MNNKYILYEINKYSIMLINIKIINMYIRIYIKIQK